jgi:hypothetical protein
MPRILAVLVLCGVVVSPRAAFCGDHLVPSTAAQRQLARASIEHAQDVATVERALSSPRAASAAATLGVSLDHLKAAVPTLSQSEVRDLAARASLVRTDPIAGYRSEDVDDLLVVLLVVAIVVVVLSAAS